MTRKILYLMEKRGKALENERKYQKEKFKKILTLLYKNVDFYKSQQ